MDRQWYYRDGTESRGPFDTNTMRQLWDAGSIGPDTPVSCGETGVWQPVSSLIGSWTVESGAIEGKDGQARAGRAGKPSKAKPRSNWWIASTHALTAGFAMPILAKIIGVVLVEGLMEITGAMADLLSAAFVVGGYLVGVEYSFLYLAKNATSRTWTRCTLPATIWFSFLVLARLLATSGGNDDAWIVLKTVMCPVYIVIFAMLTAKRFREFQATAG